MRRIIVKILICTTFIFHFISPVVATPDLELLRKKVVAEIMKTQVNEQYVKELIETIKPDGSWPGINYVDVSRTGFQNAEHMSNLVAMARAYKNQGSKLKGDRKLKNAIYSGLDFWLKNDFICDNWWYNQIGIPDQMVRFLLIMDKDITKDQVSKAIPIATRANMSASGARPSGDRIKIAGILAKNALFQHNDSLFNSTIKIIASEIKYATGPGLKYDLSFQHRPDRVTSTLSYGIGFADAFAEWAAFVTGTIYSFPEERLKLLIDYYLDGICKTMAYGKYPDPGAMNRSITRQGDLDPFGTQTPERLLIASQYRKDELEKIVRVRRGEMTSDLAATRFYWESEYFSNQRPGYFTSVRMYSSRNNNMEMPYNSEGLMNHHFADGSNFLTIKGDEYSNMFPVYDWQKIPGTTVVQKPSLPSENEIQKKGLTEFVGGVSDGVLGAAVFDFKSVHDPLVAKKSWFFFENEYVCLGAGITSEAADMPVVTTLNQCLLKGDVTVGSGRDITKAEKGLMSITGTNWVLHNGTAYIFPEPVKVSLSNISATGSWFKINKQADSPKAEIALDVFKLWIDHGQRPRNASYEYIVVPLAGQSDLNKRYNPDILSNTMDLQAVRHSGLGIGYIVFYRTGSIELFPGITIGSDGPAILMVKKEGNKVVSVSVSDPSRRLSAIHLSISVRLEKTGNHFSAVWNNKKNVTELTMDLPTDVYAGMPVTADLR